MSFNNFSDHFAKRHNYFRHSNPSMPDGYTFFDKGIIRPDRDNCWSILKGDTPGDKDEAQRRLDLHGYYKDSNGDAVYSDNPNMCAGRSAENYCTDVLVNDIAPAEAYANAINQLQSYQGASWKDADADKRAIEHKTNPRYTNEGKAAKADAHHSEFELVCGNALDGLREATVGANRVVGQAKLVGKLDDCQLGYLGYADYQDGGVELKTKWDRKADTDKPSANSLPSSIQFSHLTQIAGYWHMSGIWPKIVYANRLGYKVFEPTLDQLHAGLAAITEACKRRERLLRAAETTQDLLKLCDPDWGHNFAWNNVAPEILEEAKKLWRD